MKKVEGLDPEARDNGEFHEGAFRVDGTTVFIPFVDVVAAQQEDDMYLVDITSLADRSEGSDVVALYAQEVIQSPEPRRAIVHWNSRAKLVKEHGSDWASWVIDS